MSPVLRTCDVISFKSQGQLYQLTLAGEEIFHTIPDWAAFSQGEPRKRGKKPCDVDLKIPMKILSSTTHLTFLSSNPNILKALAKTAPTKMKWVKRRQEKQKERGGEKAKRKSHDCSVTFNYPNTVLKFCFLYMPGLCMLIFCIWIRELQSVRPVNSFVAVLAFDSQTVTRKWIISFKTRFSGKFPEANWQACH